MRAQKLLVRRILYAKDAYLDWRVGFWPALLFCLRFECRWALVVDGDCETRRRVVFCYGGEVMRRVRVFVRHT